MSFSSLFISLRSLYVSSRLEEGEVEEAFVLLEEGDVEILVETVLAVDEGADEGLLASILGVDTGLSEAFSSDFSLDLALLAACVSACTSLRYSRYSYRDRYICIYVYI